MALAVLEQIADEIEARFGVRRLAIVHRVGEVGGGGVERHHRGRLSRIAAEAFEACRYAIEELKARAPIWKAERFADGSVWLGAPARHGPEDADASRTRPQAAGRATIRDMTDPARRAKPVGPATARQHAATATGLPRRSGPATAHPGRRPVAAGPPPGQPYVRVYSWSSRRQFVPVVRGPAARARASACSSRSSSPTCRFGSLIILGRRARLRGGLAVGPGRGRDHAGAGADGLGPGQRRP